MRDMTMYCLSAEYQTGVFGASLSGYAFRKAKIMGVTREMHTDYKFTSHPMFWLKTTFVVLDADAA
jgi:hypothetical protein